MRATAGPQGQVKPSPAFGLVVGATALGAWLCVSNRIDGEIAVFIFVLSGWILSLIFHEFAHAFVAWKGGDSSIPVKGYLTLDPRRYTDPVTSMRVYIGKRIISACRGCVRRM